MSSQQAALRRSILTSATGIIALFAVIALGVRIFGGNSQTQASPVSRSEQMPTNQMQTNPAARSEMIAAGQAMSDSVSWLDHLDTSQLGATDTADLEQKLISSIDDQSNRLASVNIEDCPEDFKTSYLAQKQAWQEFEEATRDGLDYVKTLPIATFGAAAQDVWSYFTGGPGGAVGNLNDRSKEYGDAVSAARNKVRSTYRDCQTIAQRQYQILLP